MMDMDMEYGAGKILLSFATVTIKMVRYRAAFAIHVCLRLRSLNRKYAMLTSSVGFLNFNLCLN